MTLLKLVAAGLTLAYGIWAVLMPEKILSLVGLATKGPRGVTEARAALGALYIGLGQPACGRARLPPSPRWERVSRPWRRRD